MITVSNIHRIVFLVINNEMQAKCVGLRTRGERGFHGCVRAQKNFLDQLFFFCTKETITLPFIIAYRKV